MASDTSLVFNLIARDRVSPEVRTLSGRLGGLKDTLKGLVGPALAFGAVHMLGGFIADARESAKIGKITQQVIKSTGGSANITASQVGNLATAISNKTGADDEAVQSGANLLLTFTNIRNEAGKGNDIFNQTTQAATDMAAAMNDGKVTQEGVKSASMMLGKALNDPIKGMAKLTKNGVSFTDQQKDQVAALVKSGDTLGAQKVILGEVGKEFGGAAAAASDPMDKLKTNVGNLGEAVGTALIPFVDKLTTKLSSLVNFVTNNSSWLVPLVGSLAALGGTLFVIVKAVKAWREVQAALNIVMAANPVLLIALAIAALILVIVLIATKTDWFQKLWHAAWGAIKGAVSAVWNWIKTNWPLILGILAGPIGLAVVMIVKHWTTIKNAVKTALNFVKNLATTVWKWVSDKFHDAVNFISGKIAWIKGKFVDLWNRMTSGFRNIGTFIKNTATTAFNWVKNKIDWLVSYVKGLPGKIASAAKNMFHGITDAFKGAINTIIRAWNGLSFKIPGISVGPVHFGGFTLSTPNIPLLAKGGVAMAGGAAIVGENGPEMISMRKGAQVTPLSRAGSGREREELHIYFDKSGDPVLDALITHMKDRIRVRYAGDVNAALGK